MTGLVERRYVSPDHDEPVMILVPAPDGGEARRNRIKRELAYLGFVADLGAFMVAR